MIVSGKTGMRKVRLIDSLPDIRLWLNQHPLKNKPDAPCSSPNAGMITKKAKFRRSAGVDERTVNLAGINKNVYPHAPQAR